VLQLSVYSFSHRFLDLEILGQLVIPETERFQRLSILKEDLKLNEVFYIATCNRVELIMVSDKTLPKSVTGIILHSLNAQLNPQHLDVLARGVQFFSGLNAVNHLMRVSSSLESMVVGEKEILAQVRQHYQTCLEQGLTGDFLRILDKQIVKTAKKVYSQTKIADRPVSIVSLAYRLLKQHNLKKDSRILVIGAGETNQLVAKYLNKQGFKNSVVFNRTESKALELARTLGGKGFGLDALNTYSNGFDIIITCTSAPEPIITETLYAQLLSGDQGQKIIVDLALPADTSKEVSQYKNLIYIELN
jgi:glutamyl-tRNA reductase